MRLFNPPVSTTGRLVVLIFENSDRKRVRVELLEPSRDELMAFAREAVAEAREALMTKRGEPLQVVAARFMTKKRYSAQPNWLYRLISDARAPEPVHLHADDL
jgi:hypothetical protein